ncbi:MAG TPA: hypothetical protein PKA98_07605 [Acidimicrobiales bacterium]|nr:hypothetical protein [Acidimicrobiales bacterium]
MNRKKSIALLATGVVMAAVTLLGVFAAQSDSADTGTFSVESQDEASSIDLQINDLGVGGTPSGASDCATRTFVENQPVAFNLDVENRAPGYAVARYVCVRNVGAQDAFVDLELFGTANTETDCTNDETLTDPEGATCGTAGELGDDLDVTVTQVGQPGLTDTLCNEADAHAPVAYSGVADSGPQDIGGLGPFGIALDPIESGESVCYRVDISYPASTPVLDVLANQSDQVDWQFRFHGDLL